MQAGMLCVHLGGLQSYQAVYFCAATAANALIAAPVTDSTPPGVPATGNVLAGVTAPPGTTASVASITLPGSSTPVQPGVPRTVIDPTTGATAGTITVLPDGSYTFVPAPSYTGAVPPVTVTVASSDGQSKEVPLSITVSAPLTDGSDSGTVAPGTTLTLNVLDNAVAPAGTNIGIASFTLPGSTTVYTPGPKPVTVTNPATGATAGTVVVQPDGTITFTPAKGYTGQVPPITYTVASSDGQTTVSALSLTVQSGSTPVYTDAPDAVSTTAGLQATGNLLSNAAVPSGQTASITGLSIAGSTQMLCPIPMSGRRSLAQASSTCVSSGPVTLNSPTTGQPMGTLSLQANGAFTFTPASAYTRGPAPAINVYSKTSAGQTGVSLLTLDVAPGE